MIRVGELEDKSHLFYMTSPIVRVIFPDMNHEIPPMC